ALQQPPVGRRGNRAASRRALLDRRPTTRRRKGRHCRKEEFRARIRAVEPHSAWQPASLAFVHSISGDTQMKMKLIGFAVATAFAATAGVASAQTVIKIGHV